MGKDKKNEWLKFYLCKGLQSLETTLKVTSGKFSVGNEISIADLCLVPQIFHIKRNNIEFSEKLYPHLASVNNQLEKIPEFK
jgi:maleylacetoacetate isomerase